MIGAEMPIIIAVLKQIRPNVKIVVDFRYQISKLLFREKETHYLFKFKNNS